jgi:DNA-binding IscR family transcriptional regulator
VLVAVEGPIGMTTCTEGPPGECGLAARCRVHHGWQKLNEVVVGALSRMSLAEMIAPAPAALVTLELAIPSPAPATAEGR